MFSGADFIMFWHSSSSYSLVELSYFILSPLSPLPYSVETDGGAVREKFSYFLLLQSGDVERVHPGPGIQQGGDTPIYPVLYSDLRARSKC